MSEDGPAFGNFKLSLQSVVCHRGNSVNSGHYVSLVRSKEQDTAPSHESTGEKWMRLDDLAKERVAFVDAQEFLRKESPYLLFYQVQLIDDAGNFADKWRPPDAEGPPSYAVSESRYSGVADLSLSFHGSQETNIESLDLNGPTLNSSQERGDGSGMTNERRHSTFLTGTTTEAPKPSSIPGKDPNHLGAYHEDSKPNLSFYRGRPTSSPNLDKRRMSRSLSRLAGKLTKEKSSDDSTITTRDAADEPPTIQQQSSKALPAPTAGANSNGPARLKKDNNKEKQNKWNDGHIGQLIKGKQKSDKPDRECTMM